VEFKSFTGVILTVLNYDSRGSSAIAIAPGTYAVGTTPPTGTGTSAYAGAVQTDATCASTLTTLANPSGTITISSVTSSTVTGSFDVTVYGLHFNGTFNAPVCTGAFGGQDICGVVNGTGGTCTGTTQCI